MTTPTLSILYKKTPNHKLKFITNLIVLTRQSWLTNKFLWINVSKFFKLEVCSLFLFFLFIFSLKQSVVYYYISGRFIVHALVREVNDNNSCAPSVFSLCLAKLRCSH